MQSLTFIIFMVSVKIATLKFLPPTDNRLATGQSNTDHYIDSNFSCESKMDLNNENNIHMVIKRTTFHINRSINLISLPPFRSVQIKHHKRWRSAFSLQLGMVYQHSVCQPAASKLYLDTLNLCNSTHHHVKATSSSTERVQTQIYNYQVLFVCF